MKITNRFTGDTLYEGEHDTVRGCVQAALKAGADLGDAYLRGADLGYAYLRGANLRGATYGDGIPISVPPLYLAGLPFDVLILDNHAKVGCELHSIDEWAAMDEDRIGRMDRNALDMWRQWGDTIIRLARRHQDRFRRGE